MEMVKGKEFLFSEKRWLKRYYGNEVLGLAWDDTNLCQFGLFITTFVYIGAYSIFQVSSWKRVFVFRLLKFNEGEVRGALYEDLQI